MWQVVPVLQAPNLPLVTRCNGCGSADNPWNVSSIELQSNIDRHIPSNPCQCGVCGSFKHLNEHKGHNPFHRHHPFHHHHSFHHRPLLFPQHVQHSNHNQQHQQPTASIINANISHNINNNIPDIKQKIILSYYYGRNVYYFDVNPEIFSSGYHKNAYKASLTYQQRQDISAPNILNNKEFVIKKLKSGSIMYRNQWNKDLNELEKLKHYVTKWNKLNKNKEKYFVSTAHVLKTENGGGLFIRGEYLLIEPFLTNFKKWNWPNSAVNGTRYLSIQAFCHFTYHESAGSELVNDSQGYRDNDKYILTDPYYLNGNDMRIYEWFTDHCCNKHCDPNWMVPVHYRGHNIQVPIRQFI